MNEEKETSVFGMMENDGRQETVVCQKKKKCFKICMIAWNSILFLAIVGLYLLYFVFNKGEQYQAPAFTGQPGSGEVIFVNIDSLNANYALVDILTKDIESEMKKQEAIFANKQKTLEAKAAQFQKNYQSGVLNQVQIENTQSQLMQESDALRADYDRVMGDLQARETAALKQISDSLIATVQRINAKRNASFVFSYQYGGPLISADPSKDITGEVLFELNKPFKK